MASIPLAEASTIWHEVEINPEAGTATGTILEGDLVFLDDLDSTFPAASRDSIVEYRVTPRPTYELGKFDVGDYMVKWDVTLSEVPQ